MNPFDAELPNPSGQPDRPERIGTDTPIEPIIRRVVRDRTPGFSESLAGRIGALTDPAAEPRPTLKMSFASARVAIAIAAALLIGVTTGRWMTTEHNSVSGTVVNDVIPAADIAEAEGHHGYCNRLPEGLHNAGFPQDVTSLAASVANDFGGASPYPDLESIGYRFRGAERCSGPQGRSIHLLYRSEKPGSVTAISLFVQPWTNQYPLEGGRLYSIAAPAKPYPMLAWRSDRVVYFLIADHDEPLAAAAKLLHNGR